MSLKVFAGGAIFAETFGSGTPTVMALHGWGRRASDFRPVLAGFDGLAVDLPGFGASPPPKEPMGATGYARLLEPVLDEMELPIVVIGHSFGGRLAVALASRVPDAVAGLVLTGVPLVRLQTPPRPSSGYRLIRWANRRGLVSDRRLESMRRARGSADYRAASGVMRQVLVTVVNESYEPEMEVIRCPVSLIWGAEDTEVPPAVAEAAAPILRRSAAQVELTILEGVGHFVPTERPEALASAVRAQVEGRP